MDRILQMYYKAKEDFDNKVSNAKKPEEYLTAYAEYTGRLEACLISYEIKHFEGGK